MALFAPYRALGYITDDVPFAIQRRGKETYVTVSIGKAWQIYNTAKLTLVLVGPQLKRTITALACKADKTFSALTGGAIVECRRVHRSGIYTGHHTDNVISMLPMGDHLLSLGADNKLLLWKIGQYNQPISSIQLPEDFQPTSMTHPPTYLNKVVIGGRGGRMQLWNFSTGKMLYEFTPLGDDIRVMEPSPALDVIGAGLSDGRAVLINLKYDEKLVEFQNASGAGTASDLFLSGTAAAASRTNNTNTSGGGGACTALSFRTGGTGIPLMAAGGAAGVITIWDLEKQQLVTVIKDAHDASLSRLFFFSGEPLLMSSGGDNSLKQWLFDDAAGTARLLKFRSGHAAPPSLVRYYADGRRLLSAGHDRAFRVFSTIQDQQSRELSQNHTARRAKKLKVEEAELKLGRVVGVDACEVRERDWSNVITAHEGDTAAYVWRLQNCALGEHVLLPPSPTYHEQQISQLQQQGQQQQQQQQQKEAVNVLSPVTAVCLSKCGNFGFVGSASGRLDRYNMQSGMHRGCYKRTTTTSTTSTSSSSSSSSTAHDGAIYGICPDACNRWIVSAGFDGTLRVWDFKKQSLLAEIPVGVSISKLVHHATTGLLAAACDDLVIRMYDIDGRRLVRRFRGHGDRISDLQMSEDGKWLLSSSLDNTLRVWDVPGARVLQIMKLGSPVTSLSLSPAMDLLATTHVEKKGIYLWSNQLLFGSGIDIIQSERPINVRLPRAGTNAGMLDNGEEEDGNKKRKSLMAEMLGHTEVPHTLVKGVGISSGEEEEEEEESDGGMEEDVSTSEDFSSSSDDDGSDNDGDQARDKAAAVEGVIDVKSAVYAEKDGAGAPVPLVPELVTLSLLPHTQWQNLIHLDTIKARNKPVEPPKKPEAAPFFLPTVLGANAGRDPLFDLSSGNKNDEEDKEAFPSSRVVLGLDDSSFGGGGGDGSNTTLVQLLKSCSQAGDWTSTIAYIRSLSPVKLDAELRELDVLGDDETTEQQLELMLRFLDEETAANRNFELMQAVLRVVITVHGDVISASSDDGVLKKRAEAVKERVKAAWKRLDYLLQDTRCMVGVLSNLQA